MRKAIDEWLGRQRLRVSVAGEFDDAALMAAFGRERVESRSQAPWLPNTLLKAALSSLGTSRPSESNTMP